MKWKPILVAYGSLFVLGFIDNSRGPIYPEMLRDLGVGKATGSLFFSLPSLFHVLVTLFAGYLIGALKIHRLHSILLVSMSISCLVIANSQSMLGIYVSTFFLGCALGGLAVVQNVIVSQSAQGARRRQVFSGLHSMYGLASFLAPLFVEWWVSLPGGTWRNSFYPLMALPVLVILANLVLFRKEESNGHHSGSSAKENLPKRRQALVAMIAGGYVASELLISTRLVLYASEVDNLSLDRSRMMLSAFFFGLLGGRVFFGLKSFSLGNFKILGILGTLSLVVYALGIFHSSYWLCLLGLTMAGFFPTLMDYLSDFYREKSATMIARALLGVGLALSVLHLMFGWVADRYGLKQALLLGPSLLILSLICLWFHEKYGNST